MIFRRNSSSTTSRSSNKLMCEIYLKDADEEDQTNYHVRLTQGPRIKLSFKTYSICNLVLFVCTVIVNSGHKVPMMQITFGNGSQHYFICILLCAMSGLRALNGSNSIWLGTFSLYGCISVWWWFVDGIQIVLKDRHRSISTIFVTHSLLCNLLRTLDQSSSSLFPTVQHSHNQ